MILKLLTFLCFVCTVLCDWEECKDLDTVEAVHIIGHKDEEKRFRLQHNENATINIIFKSNVDSKSLTAKITGIAGPIKVPFTKFEPNTCLRGVTCPITKGKTYNFTESIFIGNYPRIPVTVRLEFSDDHEEDVVCVDIKVQVK